MTLRYDMFMMQFIPTPGTNVKIVPGNVHCNVRACFQRVFALISVGNAQFHRGYTRIYGPAVY